MRDEFLQWLKENDVQYKAGTKEIEMLCKCTHKSKKTLSVNLEKGVWNCVKCETAGALWKLPAFLELDESGYPFRRVSNYKRTSADESFKHDHENFVELIMLGGKVWYDDEYEDADKSFEKLKQFCKQKKISIETMARADVLLNITPKKCHYYPVAFPRYDEKGTVSGMRFRPVPKKDNPLIQATNSKHHAFNTRLAKQALKDGKKVLYVTEGESDCLTLIEAGYDNVISMPMGAGSTQWIGYNFDLLEMAEEIVLCFDTDDAGKKGLEKVALAIKDVGKLRTLNIPPKVGNELISDLSDLWIYGGADELTSVLENIKEIKVDGLITSYKDIPYKDMIDIPCNYQPFLEATGGMKTHSMSVVTSPPESGKSVFVNSLAIKSIEAGTPAFLYSGETDNGVIRDQIISMIAEPKDVIRKQNKYNSKYWDVNPTKDVRRRFEGNTRNMLIQPSNEITKHNYEMILEYAEVAINKYGVKLLIFDNLMTMHSSKKHRDENEEQITIVKGIKRLIEKYPVHAVLVAHPKKGVPLLDFDMYSVSGTGKIPNLADNVLAILRYYDIGKTSDKLGRLLEEATDEREVRDLTNSIKVCKNRLYGGGSGEIPLRYNFKKKTYSNVLFSSEGRLMNGCMEKQSHLLNPIRSDDDEPQESNRRNIEEEVSKRPRRRRKR